MKSKLDCTFSPLYSFDKYKYIVICSFYNNEYILSKHKERSTWEHQGGHIEEGETFIEAARRELYEESEITDAEIIPICDYTGFIDDRSANGVVFLAVVNSIGKLPKSEIECIKLFKTLPDNLTYPLATKKLYKKYEDEVEIRFKIKNNA